MPDPHAHEELHGRGVLLMDDDEREVPVFFTVTIERGVDAEGAPQLTIAGRVGIADDPWLEGRVVQHGRVLVLDDGRQLRVRIRESGRGSTTLPFRAIPLDESEFTA